MQRITRRRFLNESKKTGLAVATGVTVLANAKSARATPANDKIVLASVGLRGRGKLLAAGFLERDDCEIGYVCDVDQKMFSYADEFAKLQSRKPICVQDFRKALDDPSVDAIVSATPDHWHALSAIWGCQAGKDVYVEKPAAHNCWEGQQMVKAARKYNRIVQVGTQCRSAPYLMAAKKYIEDGKLGDIHMVRVYDQKEWKNRDVVPDAEVPEGLDWDMWSGPAPLTPYNRNSHSYWNHLWRYSGGDIANDSSHQIDVARWLCGAGVPKNAYSIGGRYASNGVAQTPDTQIACYEYDKMVMTFEMTLYTPYMLKCDPVLRESDMFPHWPQNATRTELYGTKGYMVVGRHGGGWQVFERTKDRKPVVTEQMYGRFPDPEHKENFLSCIRSRKRPNADVLEGHLSALLINYGNISYRLGGEKLTINQKTEEIVDNRAAMDLFKRTYREPWVIPEEV